MGTREPAPAHRRLVADSLNAFDEPASQESQVTSNQDIDMNHALKLSFAIALALVAISGCSRDYDTTADDAARTDTPAADATTPSADAAGAAPTTAPEPGTAPSTPNAPATGALTQGQAVALVGAVDKHEIAAAEQARGKKVTGEVLDFANLLHREHSTNLQAGEKLGMSETSPEVTAMEEKGRSELATLDQQTGKDYEKAYIDAMVKGHQEALSLIDDRLLPAAQDDNVRAFLTNSREHVAMHLERAKSLQQNAGATQ
jgi:putative membrane protein